MSTEYQANEGLQAELDAMLRDVSLSEFGPIREHDIKILSCTKIKLDAEGEPVESKGDAVQVKKVSDLHRSFIDGHYIVVVDSYVFDHTDDGQLKALIHSALMQIKVEATETGIKLGTRKPDIRVFQETLNRFGAYTDALANLSECLDRGNKRFAAMIAAEPEPEQDPEPEPDYNPGFEPELAVEDETPRIKTMDEEVSAVATPRRRKGGA